MNKHWVSLPLIVAVGVMSAADAGGLAASANGGYQVDYGGQLRTVEFTATRDARNVSRGQGHLFNHESGAKLHFVINCLQVAGNEATISGTISDYNASVFLEGMPFWLRVVDLGEGARGEPDRATPLTVFFAGQAPTCAEDGPGSLFSIAGGNIQVP